jgi:hypothetical protein
MQPSPKNYNVTIGEPSTEEGVWSAHFAASAPGSDPVDGTVYWRKRSPRLAQEALTALSESDPDSTWTVTIHPRDDFLGIINIPSTLTPETEGGPIEVVAKGLAAYYAHTRRMKSIE